MCMSEGWMLPDESCCWLQLNLFSKIVLATEFELCMFVIVIVILPVVGSAINLRFDL
jgi:hypothetical protein